MPSGLLESELFGYERGAFTGAATQTMGRFQAADRGTLLLDEIGDVPLELQPKLLRALQDQQIERLGSGGRLVSVDVRVIAATNQNLWEMVQRGAFRADLYYRLNVFPIVIPPLRHRSGDIPLLVTHFVRRFAERYRKAIQHIPEEVLARFKRHPWPGNVRELQNVIERAVLATKGSSLHVPSSDTHQVEKVSVSRTLAEVERDHILHTLRESHWVVGGWNGAAARLGLSRTTLIARMQRLGIARESRPDGNLPSVISRSTATKPRNGGNSGDAGERCDDPHWSASCSDADPSAR